MQENKEHTVTTEVNGNYDGYSTGLEIVNERHPNETQEHYYERRREANRKVRSYLKGRIVYVASQLTNYSEILQRYTGVQTYPPFTRANFNGLKAKQLKAL